MKSTEEVVDLGIAHCKDGDKKIEAVFRIYRDEREVAIFRLEGGSIAVNTKSHLRENDHKLVETTNLYTERTFTMMLESMILGASYFGIDLKEACKQLHGDGGVVNYEYGGLGEFDPSKSEFVRSKVTMITAEDWEGLYVDGKLVTEGHSVRRQDLVEQLSRLPDFIYEEDCADSDWLAERGRLPTLLSEVKLED